MTTMTIVMKYAMQNIVSMKLYDMKISNIQFKMMIRNMHVDLNNLYLKAVFMKHQWSLLQIGKGVFKDENYELCHIRKQT
jgi:hypothetical protein